MHAIGKALAAADRRLDRWQSALDNLPDGKAVEVDTLTKSFPGIDEHGGTFRAHLELAALAVALKRRVIVLQAVEHAQIDPGNLFENFARALKADQQRLDKLESSIAGVLVRLSTLELARPRGLRAPVFTSGEVDRLMRAATGFTRWVTASRSTTVQRTWRSRSPATRTARWSCFQRWPRKHSHARPSAACGSGGSTGASSIAGRGRAGIGRCKGSVRVRAGEFGRSEP